MPALYKLLPLFYLILLSAGSLAQQPAADTLHYKTIAANSSFQKKSNSYQRFWGHNRRPEWATPITVPLLWLDSLYGGLKPYELGGGNETKSLRLRTTNGKEYTLRSINKSRDQVIPPDFKKSFAENIIRDQVSSSYPYGAMPVTIMEQQAGIYHTVPVLVYLPTQPALDTFNNKYANDLYLFEQRPAEDWSEAANMGNFKDFSSTEKVIQKLQEDNKYKADQPAFIKARLFDMLIGDWDRHEDNWRWGKRKIADKTLYVPFPRDRDQAFYTHNGLLLDFLLPIGGFSYMQNFSGTAGNMIALNKEERNMDKFFSNEMNLDDWINAAKALQQSLTDTVISQSVQQLPPEIFSVSGKELIEKIKSRRNQLIDMATSYYLFIAKQVEIIGTKEKEYFEIKRNDNGEAAVSVFQINKNGKKENDVFYKRTFKPSETSEIRIFGIDGQDIFYTEGNTDAITVRIIGGPSKDSVVQSGSRIHIYDNKNNAFQTSNVRWHLSPGRAINKYDYENHEYNSKGFGPAFSYDHQDRVYVGLSYRFKKYKWRRQPYAAQHIVGVNYSITQHSVSAFYSAVYPRIISNWDLLFNAKFDAAGWVNFAGPGNETIRNVNTTDYYQMRGGELLTAIGLRRNFGKSTVNISAFYQHIKITNDTGRYAAKIYQPLYPAIFDPASYAGLRLSYTYASVNDVIIPTKGFTFLASGIFADEFSQKEFFQNYTARIQAWLPLGKKFSLSIKTGGTAIVGNSAVVNSARPYEHAIIGGPETFRGYRTERFWGKTSFYNNNELRFITNIKTYLLNARAGLLLFADDGRVWMPNENSNMLHTSYGGGIIVAPFHQFCFTLTYGISHEAKMVQFRFNTLL